MTLQKIAESASFCAVRHGGPLCLPTALWERKRAGKNREYVFLGQLVAAGTGRVLRQIFVLPLWREGLLYNRFHVVIGKGAAEAFGGVVLIKPLEQHAVAAIHKHRRHAVDPQFRIETV